MARKRGAILGLTTALSRLSSLRSRRAARVSQHSHTATCHVMSSFTDENVPDTFLTDSDPDPDEPSLLLAAGTHSRLRRRPAVVRQHQLHIGPSTALVCGAERAPADPASDTWWDARRPAIVPSLPSPLDGAAPVAIAIPARPPSTTGCGARVHAGAQAARSRGRWMGPVDGVAATVVPLADDYFSEEDRSVLELRAEGCGCRVDGVGCAICGNSLGALFTPCAAHTSRSSARQTHYTFLPVAVSPPIWDADLQVPEARTYDLESEHTAELAFEADTGTDPTPRGTQNDGADSATMLLDGAMDSAEILQAAETAQLLREAPPAPATDPSAWPAVPADERMNIDALVTPDVAPTRAPMQVDAPERLATEPLPPPPQMTLSPASPARAPTTTLAMIGAAADGVSPTESASTALSSLSLQLMAPAWSISQEPLASDDLGLDFEMSVPTSEMITPASSLSAVAAGGSMPVQAQLGMLASTPTPTMPTTSSSQVSAPSSGAPRVLRRTSTRSELRGSATSPVQAYRRRMAPGFPSVREQESWFAQAAAPASSSSRRPPRRASVPDLRRAWDQEVAATVAQVLRVASVMGVQLGADGAGARAGTLDGATVRAGADDAREEGEPQHLAALRARLGARQRLRSEMRRLQEESAARRAARERPRPDPELSQMREDEARVGPVVVAQRADGGAREHHRVGWASDVDVSPPPSLAGHGHETPSEPAYGRVWFDR
ncbi:hypothetical protein GGX14DRAFT_545068 [Mycena pura]|uniref:Uncharacterized protein n=1 Tax=Mycena pura TaxID=153505 RepID=A0AAD6UZZ5_9AGAR|nr:hypothetical protein GGX14DRAFT_545068 [Mycena pura]